MIQMKYDSNKIKKTIIKCFVGVTLGFMVVGAYAKFWEKNQRKIELKNVVVNNVEPYNFRNDLHWDLKGYRININEDLRNIDFPIKYWNKEIGSGDTIDIVVRNSYPMGVELDGLKITKIKKSENKFY